jgi:hypothetical protein
MSVLLTLISLLHAQSLTGIQVKSLDAKDVYLIDYTTDTHVADVHIINNSESRLIVEVLLGIPEYMVDLAGTKVALTPGESRTLNISVPLLEDAFALTRPKQLQGTLYIQTYNPVSEPLELWKQSFELTLYDIGYIRRETAVEQLITASRLITLKDSIITQQLEMFGISQAPQSDQPKMCYGYLRDKLKPGKGPFDAERITLPRQLIRNKYGTQRDWLILYASLLKNCGFHTALGQVPAQSHEVGWLLLYFPSTSATAVEWKGRRWNIVVFDDLQKTFEQACVTGRQVWSQWGGSPLQMVDVEEQWQNKPVLQLPPTEALELATQLRESKQLAVKGDIVAAKAILLRLQKIDPDNAAIYNNLGNLWLHTDLNQAISNYQKAVRLDATDARIYLNLGIAYYLAEKQSESDAAFDKAYAGIANYRNMCYALGIPPDKPYKPDGYEGYRQLLRNAELRATYSKLLSSAMGGRRLTPVIPVYWKPGL